jgi:hypothetical protein
MKVVIIERDWSDEFYTYGFATFTDEEYQKFLDNIENSKYPLMYGFGTNEQHEFHSPEDYKSSMQVVDITDEEHEIIHKIFHPYLQLDSPFTFAVGIFPII